MQFRCRTRETLEANGVSITWSSLGIDKREVLREASEDNTLINKIDKGEGHPKFVIFLFKYRVPN